MNTAQDYPTLPDGPLDDCRGFVRILSNNLTPPRKLRAILPILIERRPFSRRDPYRRLPDTTLFGRVETELHTRTQIETIVGGGKTTCQKTARTDSKVIHTTLHSVANACGRADRQILAHLNEIAARHNEQLVPGNLRFCHPIQLKRVHGRVVEVAAFKDCFDCRDVITGRSSASEQKG